jgi:DNA/RNA-binding domain of Phe-tRNA-synthetase-like protein
VAKIAEYVEVRYATGSEISLAFSGEIENPYPGEVIFADHLGRAHARRWTNRQSGYSTVRKETTTVLIVAEAVHRSAQVDIEKLMGAITAEIKAVWSAPAKTKILNRFSPQFEF